VGITLQQEDGHAFRDANSCRLHPDFFQGLVGAFPELLCLVNPGRIKAVEQLQQWADGVQ
jgi:hypothetical protein